MQLKRLVEVERVVVLVVEEIAQRRPEHLLHLGIQAVVDEWSAEDGQHWVEHDHVPRHERH